MFAPPLRDRYARTLAAFARHDTGTRQAASLARELVRVGEEARAWQRAGGTGAREAAERREQAGFARDVPSMAAAARRLARLVREHAAEIETPIAFAQLAVRREKDAAAGWCEWWPSALGTHRDDYMARSLGPYPAAADLASLLDALAHTLRHDEFRNPLGLPRLADHTTGPLLFDAPLHGRKSLPDEVTALLFGAVFLARHLTSEPPGRWRDGGPMPLTGRPLYPVAAALCADAIGAEMTDREAEDRLRKFLNRNPGVQWRGYSKPDALPKLSRTRPARRPRAI